MLIISYFGVKKFHAIPLTKTERDDVVQKESWNDSGIMALANATKSLLLSKWVKTFHEILSLKQNLSLQFSKTNSTRKTIKQS